MTPTPVRGAAGYRAASATVRIGVRHLLNVRLDVEGAPRLPEGGMIIACNHLSPLDTVVLGMVLADAGRSPLAVVAPDEIHHPLFALLHRSGAISVGDSAPAYSQAREAVWRGRPVIWQPEPVPSVSLDVGTFRREAAHLAIETGVPVVPTAVFGAHRLFEGGRFRMRRDVPVGVTFGYPMEVGDAGDISVMQTVRQDVEARLEQTLDRYRDRERGEAGADWWPAWRGGSAPERVGRVAPVDREAVDLDGGAIELPTKVRRDLSSTLLPAKGDHPLPQAPSAAPIISHEVARPPRWNVGVRYRGWEVPAEMLKSVDVHLDLADWPGRGRVEPGADGRRLEFRVDAIDLTPDKLHLEGLLTQDRLLQTAVTIPRGTPIELVAVPG